MKTVTEFFAYSAGFAVNKIEPRRTLRTLRELRKSVSMGALTEFFAFSARSAVTLKRNRGGRKGRRACEDFYDN